MVAAGRHHPQLSVDDGYTEKIREVGMGWPNERKVLTASACLTETIWLPATTNERKTLFGSKEFHLFFFFFRSFLDEEVSQKLCQRSRVKSLILGGIVLYFIGLQCARCWLTSWLDGCCWVVDGRSLVIRVLCWVLFFTFSLRLVVSEGFTWTIQIERFFTSYLAGYLVWVNFPISVIEWGWGVSLRADSCWNYKAKVIRKERFV